MIALVTTVFVASIIGSLHCAGMCGGIVTLCVAGKPVGRGRAWTPHALYNLGRLITYALLGAVSGALGAAIDLGGTAVGWSRTAAIVAGGTMIVFGLTALIRGAGVHSGAVALPRPLQAAMQRAFAIARGLPAEGRGLLIGLLTGLLPCGWLYAFVIAAAGTASPWMGVLTMTAFWAGTLPVMLVMGLGVQSLSAGMRRRVPGLTAGALVLVGTVTVLGRLELPAAAAAAAPATSDPLAHVKALDADEMPCCQHEQ